MPQARSWLELRTRTQDQLLRQTGGDVSAWNARIREQGLAGEADLRAWLTSLGVTGYRAYEVNL